MQVGRIKQTIYPPVNQNATPAVAPKPVVSVPTAVSQINLPVVSPATRRPLTLTPGPEHGLPGLLPFVPGIVPAGRDVAVVRTPAAATKAAETVANARAEAEILDRAKAAGLSPDELGRLQKILDTSPDFKADAALLKEVLPESGSSPYWANPDRALRTWIWTSYGVRTRTGSRRRWSPRWSPGWATASRQARWTRGKECSASTPPAGPLKR